MKHLVKLVVVTFFLIASTNVFAEQKVVVLDLKFVLNNSQAGKEAQDYLKTKFNKNAKQFTEMEKKLKKEESDLLESKTSISKEEYTKKSDNLRKKVIDYQSERRASLDDLAKQRLNARETLIKKLTPLIDSHINENSISLVIDKQFMLGGMKGFDITSVIIEKLNKEIPSLNLK